VVVGATGIAAVVALVVRDPHVPGSWGSCPVLALTGCYCPGCGGLRALHDVAHGDIAGAVSSNLYAVGIFALAAAIWLGWLRAGLSGERYRLTWLPDRTIALAGTVGLAVFTLARNIPAFAVLAP
jgi:hypothetical protein